MPVTEQQIIELIAATTDLVAEVSTKKVVLDNAVIATAADRVQTALDVTATSEDRIQTALDVLATTQSAEQTNLDAIQTAADRVQTALDRIAVASLISSPPATWKIILGQRDTLVNVTPVNGSTTDLDYNAGSYHIDLSALTNAHAVVFTSSNWPGGIADRGLQEIFLKVGATLPLITWPAGWVTVIPIVSKTNNITVDSVGASAPTMVAGRTF